MGRPRADRTGAPPAPFVRWLTLALLVAATILAFAGTLRNGWLLVDDPLYVTRNPHVARGLTLDGLLWFLREPHGENWHPLTSWSHMLDVQLFGLAPAGHHAMSLALHALNAALLACVLFGLTGAWWRSLLVAAFFALHPLRVESVAWVAERKDVLSALFFLLAIAAYRRWVSRPTGGRYSMVVIALGLGLMAKPMLVTLPAVLVLLDVWPLGRLAGSRRSSAAADAAPARSLSGLVAEKWPLFALAAASAVLTFLVQRRTGAVAPVDAFPIGGRLANALVSYWRYVGKTLWPSGLTPHYAYGAASVAAAFVAGVAIVVVTVLVLRGSRSRPYLAVGWLWYVGMLVPVIGLVQVGGQAYADRYTYLPVIGLAIAAVWGVADVVAPSRLWRTVASALALCALVTLAVATARQVALWRDSRTLFAHTLAVEPDNRFAHRWLGEALLQAGERREAVPHLERSLSLPLGYEDGLRRALAANPADLETRRMLAMTLAREDRVEEAIQEYGRILARSPDDLDALVNVAWIRATHEQSAHRNGAEAVRLAERARGLSPEPLAVIYSTLGAAYAEAGRFPEAVRSAERAIALARAGHEPAEARRYEQQLERYRARRPFHFGE